MINWIALFVFCGAHTIPWVSVLRRSKASHPMKIVAALSFVTNTPYFILIILGYRNRVTSLYTSRDLDNLIFEFSTTYSIGIISLYLILHLISSKKNIKNKEFKNDSKIIFIFIMIMSFIFYVFATLNRVTSVGGYGKLIENLDHRTTLFRDEGFLGVLLQPTAFLFIFILIFVHGYYKKYPKYTVFILLTFVVVTIGMYGGRKLPLYILFFSTISWHTYVKKIKVFSISSIIIVLIGLFIFTSLLFLRKGGDVNADGFYETASLFIANLSYIDTYIFIIDEYRNSYLYGGTFIDLLIRFGIYPWDGGPTPLDDGVYVRTRFDGPPVVPPVAFKNLFPSSWPPESFGGGFMNFGHIGVVLFFMVRGAVIGIFFNYFNKSYNPIILFMYIFMTFNFHFTNLRIAQAITVLVPIFFTYFLFWMLKTILKRGSP